MTMATKMPAKWWVLCALTVLFAAMAHSASAQPLWANDAHIFISDKPHSLSEIIASDGWRPFTREDVNQGISDAHYWLKFTLINDEAKPIFRILSAEISYLDQMTVYWRASDSDALEEHHFSDRQNFDSRALFYRTLATPLTVPPMGSLDVYLHAHQSKPDSVSLRFLLEAPPDFGARQQMEYLWFGVFYGALAIMIIMALVFAVSLRQRNALYYALFLLCSLVFWLMLNGLGYQYLWPQAVWWHNEGFHLVYLAFVVSALQFSKHFLQLVRLAPRLHTLINVLQLLALAGVALRIAGLYLPVLVLSYTLLAALALLIPLASAIAWRRGLDYALWSLLAWLIYALGLLASLISAATSIASWGMAPLVTVQAACLLETLFLMIGLSKWLVQLELDHQRAITLAHEDPLTGLGNRRRLQSAFEQILLTMPQDKRPTYLIMIDLDYFKAINDTYGHDAGDQVLEEVGALLRKVCRDEDVTTRFGGEEFAVLVRAPDQDTAAHIAERIRAEFADTPTQYRNQSIPHTLSCGIAEVLNEHWQPSVQEMMRRADEALYQAKAAGRNQVHL